MTVPCSPLDFNIVYTLVRWHCCVLNYSLRLLFGPVDQLRMKATRAQVTYLSHSL